MGYLFLLFAIFIAYEESVWLRTNIPARLGQLPVGTIWFGALGAVMISHTGIFLHRYDWKSGFEEWHVARPFLGAVIGPIGCLLLIVIIDAANRHASSPDPTFYDVAAFLVGYREETFRLLIKRGTDVLLGSEVGKGAGRDPR